MKIVIAVDKFKGCATSQQLAQCIHDTIGSNLPNANIVTVPIADGGDGTMQAFKGIISKHSATSRRIMVPAPLPELPLVDAEYLLESDSMTAYLDLATASGLALVPPQQRDVMRASTYGTGLMISDAMSNGAKHVVMGLGGSASCDAAMGILAALGCTFLDHNNQPLTPCGGSLNNIKRIDTTQLNLSIAHTRFTLLTDVNNPLTGPNGAAAIFAPQKGASPQQVIELEHGLKNFVSFLPAGIDTMSGAGAAGGVAAGMAAFLGATIVPGIDFLLNMAQFNEIIADADLVITGEGRIDNQTMMGKAPAGVLRAAKQFNIPVIALCGSIAPGTNSASLGFSSIIEVSPHDMPLAQAMDTKTTLTNVSNAVGSLVSKMKL